MGRNFKKFRRSSDQDKKDSGDKGKGKGQDKPAKRTGGGFKRDREDRPQKKDNKVDKKGEGKKNLTAKKNISVAKLREEQKNKKAKDGKGKRFNRFKKDRKKGKKGGKIPRDPEKRKEFLDKEMETYWMKGGHTELVSKRLD